MTTLITGIDNNSTSEKIELILEIDDDHEGDGPYAILQMRDYDRGDDRSVEFLIEDLSTLKEFLEDSLKSLP